MDLVLINQPQVYPYRKLYQNIKRLFDIAICLIFLPFLVPILLICGVAVRLDSPGPAIFVQERIGKGGRPFKMYKFRTMRHNLDKSAREAHYAFMKAFVSGKIGGDECLIEAQKENNSIFGKMSVTNQYRRAFLTAFASSSAQEKPKTEAIYKPIQDAQITRVGRFLRKTSLDELPQVWNVLKGEMSLVGPRPNVPWEVDAYQPWHYERLEVLPGMTGLAQVRGRSGISFNRIVQYDIEYIDKQSLSLDLRILWWTVATVKKGAGAK